MPTADPERLTTAELLAAHERLFGALTPQARTRMLGVDTRPERRGWEGMDGLAA